MKLFRLPAVIVRKLLVAHERAQATPYFDIDGYMLRSWMLGYNSVARNNDKRGFKTRVGGLDRGAWYQWLTKLLVIRAHTILRSDNDRHFHDHPSASLSIVLDGYWEQVPHPANATAQATAATEPLMRRIRESSPTPAADLIAMARDIGVHWRGPGEVVVRRASSLHRLILPRNHHARSIFMIGPRVHGWGFMTDKGKVPWKEYLQKYQRPQTHAGSEPQA